MSWLTEDTRAHTHVCVPLAPSRLVCLSPRQLLTACALAPVAIMPAAAWCLRRAPHTGETVVCTALGWHMAHYAEVPVLQLRKLRHRVVVQLGRGTREQGPSARAHAGSPQRSSHGVHLPSQQHGLQLRSCARGWLRWPSLCLLDWKPSSRSLGDGCGSGRPSCAHLCPEALRSVVKIAQSLGFGGLVTLGRNLHVERAPSGRLAAHRVRLLPWPRAAWGMSLRAVWDSGAQPLT